MKLFGALFILAASGSVGIKISKSLRQRCSLLRQLLLLLNILRNEISFYGSQLSQAFEKMSSAAGTPWKELFERVSAEMKHQRWLTPQSAVEMALEEIPVDFAETILINLMQSIGKYDLDAQLAGISAAEEETKRMLQQLEQERSFKSKTYQTLGFCAGAAAVIILM